LSSGSRINSGADDAAGLSLVDGLQANQQALAQSQTNTQEGVGLLQVADGALSQVTNLLNRAVTLATEVSNGTLNGAQQTAANQEYHSILDEITNIGSTTTYNQTKVFGNGTVGVYSGDSSSTSASLDNLNITALSSTDVGNQGGNVTYNTGQNTFLDLSNGVTAGSQENAQSTDTLAGTTMTISYENPDGSAQTVVTSNATTVSGLMTAINSSGRGLTASFTTAAAAGATSAGIAATDTGIMISGDIDSSGTETTGGEESIAVTTGGYDTSAGYTAVNAAGHDLKDSNTGGIAAINYSTSGGQDLTANDLTSQTTAEASLTTLNAAILDVAAQDGYVGAQINTLNAVGQVLSTQQENVQSAQNAVQATDYAAATSNMSKYEILSQTGISALAQANSMAQEVTKLLQ
jgi:flagellin